MDNLDRTNVAQSAIAKWMLDRQLRDIGVLKEKENIDTYEDFMHHFRNSTLVLLRIVAVGDADDEIPQCGPIMRISFPRRTVALVH